MKKKLQSMQVRNKRIVLRLDYNIPLRNGVILDDSKIRSSLETIKYLLEQNCKIIILSHLGKIKSNGDKLKYSLEIAAAQLNNLLNTEEYFSKENYGLEITKRVSNMKEKEILILENTRFLDIPKKLESNCDPQLSEFWASLGDIYVNDAFGSSHRRHASTYGIAKYIPSCIGFLIQKELKALDNYIMNPEHPFTLVMGGAKMDDKISLIESLLPKCDYILCGGGIANTCLKALGLEIGESTASYNPEVYDKVKELLLKNKEKFVLPLDAIVGSTYDKDYIKYKLINDVDYNDVIYDIGTKTIEKFKSILEKSKTVFLNGTVGLYEDMRYANGTKELLEVLKNLNANIIVGGGDAASSVRTFGYENDVTYISSGGGATLDYLAKGTLEALDSIEEEDPVIEILDM